ncbi:MAG: hypothetical protein ABI620_04005 [Chloroflexota bacterium]
MTASNDFDRLLGAWLESLGPPDMRAEATSRGLDAARGVAQRRGLAARLVGPASWPAYGRRISFGTLPPVVRILIVATLVAATIVATVAVGSLLLRTPAPPPPIVVLPSLVAPGPTPTARPIVEELGTFTTGQVSAFGAALLTDGRVLVAGGVDTASGEATLDTAWLFDPATSRLDLAGNLTTPRTAPIVIGLLDGRALVLGGYAVDESGQQLTVTTAEIFDPGTGTSIRTADPPFPRTSCPCGALNNAWAASKVVRLADGRVLLVGGTGLDQSAPIEVFDPLGDTFTPLAGRCDTSRGAVAVLGDGRVLLTCLSLANGPPPEAMLFDPRADAFLAVGAPTTDANDMANVLRDGRVLLTGGSIKVDRGMDLFDPQTGQFTILPSETNPDGFPGGFDMPDGRLLFLGFDAGLEPQDDLPAQIFDPATLSFSPVADAGFDVADVMIRLADGRILTIGYQLDVRLLDPSRLP